MIQTVTGPLAVQRLERVLMHEHIVLGYAGWFYDPRCTVFDHDKAQRQTLDRLKKLRDRGVNLVVDPCPIELGRAPAFMQEMSQKSGVHIVCSTGFDLQARGYLSAFREATAEEICDIYLSEIREGIGPEKIRPGIIKVATGHSVITEYEQRCIQAACQASIASGLPIITHTERGTLGPEQARCFRSHGVDPRRCLIGHCCASSDLRYQQAILEEGVYVGFDRFGNHWHGDDNFRFSTLVALIHMGYARRLFLGTDSVAHLLKTLPGNRDMQDWDPVLIFDRIVPRLAEHGVSAQDIEAMLANNARDFWTLEKERGAQLEYCAGTEKNIMEER